MGSCLGSDDVLTEVYVAGIGRDAAAKIWYRALTVYMTSSMNYASARAVNVSCEVELGTVRGEAMWRAAPRLLG